MERFILRMKGSADGLNREKKVEDVKLVEAEELTDDEIERGVLEWTEDLTDSQSSLSVIGLVGHWLQG